MLIVFKKCENKVKIFLFCLPNKTGCSWCSKERHLGSRSPRIECFQVNCFSGNHHYSLLHFHRRNYEIFEYFLSEILIPLFWNCCVCLQSWIHKYVIVILGLKNAHLWHDIEIPSILMSWANWRAFLTNNW
jgi:hypothetical protein